jgi:serine O-acetyltransferase
MATNNRLKKRGDLTRSITKAEKFHNGLTKSIVEKYEEHQIGHRLDSHPLPSQQGMVEILSDLFEVMAPGYGRRQNLKPNNVGFFVRDRSASLEDRLALQIAIALRATPPKGEVPHRGHRANARKLANAFMARIPNLMDHLAEDTESAYWRDPSSQSIEEILISYPGPKAIWTHRISHELYRLGVPLIPRMMSEYAHAKTGIDIHPGASIGRRFFIDHGTGVVIGQTARIYDDVTIYQGVTLGAISLPRDEDGRVHRDKAQRHPTIEKGVVIYANATILGGKTVIGAGAVIGASAWVTESVEPGATIGRNAQITGSRSQVGSNPPSLSTEIGAPKESDSYRYDINIAMWEDDGGKCL